MSIKEQSQEQEQFPFIEYVDLGSSHCWVNTQTGEVLEDLEHVYETVPKSKGKVKSRFELKKEKSQSKTQMHPPLVCKSVDQIEDWLDSWVDCRKLVTASSVESYHDKCLGDAKRNSTTCTMTMPQYKLLQKLVPLIKHKNIVLCSRKALCKALGVVDNHLNRTLTTLGLFIRRETVGVRVGEVKLFINPNLAFKYTGSGLNKARKIAMKDWYIGIQSSNLVGGSLNAQ